MWKSDTKISRLFLNFFHEYLNGCAFVIYVLSFSKKYLALMICFC